MGSNAMQEPLEPLARSGGFFLALLHPNFECPTALDSENMKKQPYTQEKLLQLL